MWLARLDGCRVFSEGFRWTRAIDRYLLLYGAATRINLWSLYSILHHYQIMYLLISLQLLNLATGMLDQMVEGIKRYQLSN